jgi:integrase
MSTRVGEFHIHVSLSDLAVDVLERQRGKHLERVFTYEGNPIRYVNTKAWRNALKRAWIMDFRWHDLRHTRASCLIQNGTPLYDLQKMGGWKSAHMACHAAVVDGLLRVTSTAQSVEEGIQKKASRSLVTP